MSAYNKSMQNIAWRLKKITMFSPYLKVTYKLLELESLNISQDHNLISLKQVRKEGFLVLV